MFLLTNYLTKTKYYGDSNTLVMGKKKYQTSGVATKKFFELREKLYSLLVDNNSEHKKAKDVIRNVVATIIHKKYKDVLLNNKYLKQSVNWIKSKDHKTGNAKFRCAALMTKDISKTMDMID